MQKDNKELVIGGTLQQKISSCLNVLDRLLNQEEPIVSSMVVAEKRDKRIGGENPLDVVATLLGIKDMKTISQQSTLSELGMDSMMVNEILQTLEKEFEIFITPKELRNLTIAKLSELGNEKSTTIKQDQKTNQNLEQMLPENTTDPIIKLPSLVKPSEKAVKIFVLPGIEGALKLLEPLTKNLNAHVLGLQYIVQNCDTIRKIALELLPVIETNLEGNKQFCLLGYSFGAVIALELGLLLEEKNYSGSIISIDGSPHYIAKIFLQKISQETTREIGVLCHVLSHILPPTLIEQHKEKLSKCKNLDEKIVTALSLIPPESALYQKLDKENIRKLYDRCEAIANYSSTEKKLKSSVKLYRAEIPIIDIEPDYKLQNLCEEKVEIVTIQGDHSSILAQPELFQDINQLIKL
ncbi:fatty acid synthase-like [Tribolium madens]|uniref:fatty acid synthase-like n=1 Tax=Tribolium madens TaxID=41895 RepID=UPI001CF72C16|nr:fatty acid synthase-like [Tribolium madens]